MITSILFAVAGPLSVPQDLKAYSEKLPKSTIEIKMVPIPGGKVKVGDKTVDVAPFYMCTTETPWEVFDQYLLSGEPSKPYDQTAFGPDVIARPSYSYILPDLGWGHEGYPVINVSSTTVEMFFRWLRATTKKKYRLPTEAEWQLACQGGADADFKISAEDLDKAAWHKGNSSNMTHPVGEKAASKLGLFDILGNVGEWATDADGKPVLCGGDFLSEADKQNSTLRRRYQPSWQETDPQLPKSRWWLADAPFAGFRIVCEK